MVNLRLKCPDRYHKYNLNCQTMFWFDELFKHVGEICSLLGHKVLLFNGLAYIDDDIQEHKNPVTYDTLMYVYPNCIYNWLWQDYLKAQDTLKKQDISRKESLDG